MRFWRCILADLRAGSLCLVGALLLGLLSSALVLFGTFLQCAAWQIPWDAFTLGDYVLTMCGGTLPPPIDDLSRSAPPAGWLLLFAGSMCAPLVYTQRSLRRGGVSMILACGRRSSWLAAKMLWSVVSVITFWVGVGISCLCVKMAGTGGFSMCVIEAVAMVSVPDPYALIAAPHDMTPFCLTMLGVSAVLAVIVSSISVQSNSGAAFVVFLVLTMPSLFVMSPLLPGHYLMALRSREMIEAGVNAAQALGGCVVVLVGIVVASLWSFGRVDFLGGALRDD